MNVIESINTKPEDWVLRACTLRHKSGKRVWICSLPIVGTNMYPPVSMSWSMKAELYFAVRRWIKNQPLHDFS